MFISNKPTILNEFLKEFLIYYEVIFKILTDPDDTFPAWMG